MRLLELHLDRFGIFTGRRVSFSPDAALTVVYGANETGKSTALVAIADVLYGIEERSRFDFLHRYSDMRLGATILSADRQQLTFRRRKGRENTILNTDETPLHDGALLPFLGSVGKTLFLDAFGLNRERLRAGARQLIDGGGDVAESLLAAAPGLSSLIDLRTALSTEAEALFPVGRKVASRPFWQACDRYTEARRRVRENSLHADTVRTARRALEETEEALKTQKQEQRTLREEMTRHTRLKTALPRLKRIDQLVAALAALGTLPHVDDDFASRCKDMLERRKALADDLIRLDRDQSEVKSALELVTVDDAILAEAVMIDELVDQRGAILKAADDLPKREGEFATLNGQLDEIARRLGLASGPEVLARRPDDASIVRARRLITERRRLDDHRKETADRLADLSATFDDIVRRQDALGRVADPGPLRRKFELLGGLAERIDARDALARSIKQRARDLDERLQRLTVAVESADYLAALPVPAANLVEDAMGRFDDLRKRGEELRVARGRLETEKARIDRKLSDLAATGDVPTPEAVIEGRHARDTIWSRLRGRLLHGDTAIDVTSEIPVYERAVSHADILSDRRQQEAERVATFSKLQADASDNQIELAANGRALAELETEQHAADTTWVDLWAGVVSQLKSPREMRTWLQARDDILSKRDELEAERSRLSEATRRVDDAVTALSAIATSVGLTSAETDPLDLASEVSAAVTKMDERFQAARLLEQESVARNRDRENLRSALADLEGKDEVWRGAWAEAAPSLGIRLNAAVEEAEAVLNAWQAVPAIESSLKDLDHRIARMREDRNTFEANAQSLTANVAPDLADERAEVAAATLRKRFVEAQGAAGRRAGLQTQIKALDERRTGMEHTARALDANVAALVTEAQTSDAGMLSGIVAKLEEMAELSSRLEEERTELLSSSDGLAEVELRAQLEGLDPDGLAARLQALADDEDRLQEALNETVRRETTAKAELEALTHRVGAAGAAQDEQNALAEIAEMIDTWTLTAAAERLLSAAIEAYRNRHQNPVLHRAGEAFAIATANAFSGITVDYDDADKPRIVAVRSDQSRVAVDALSEGTADQLFLALRVATIEDHARRAAPLPFIADDLFVTFDDPRTAAGLKLLADLGRTTQTIVFTHHQHVVEAAQRSIGDGVQIVEL
jgi:uncharacterized protein YhaN